MVADKGNFFRHALRPTAWSALLTHTIISLKKKEKNLLPIPGLNPTRWYNLGFTACDLNSSATRAHKLQLIFSYFNSRNRELKTYFCILINSISWSFSSYPSWNYKMWEKNTRHSSRSFARSHIWNLSTYLLHNIINFRQPPLFIYFGIVIYDRYISLV